MTAVPSPHPTGDRLHAFSQGRLDESELTLVEAHLETCPECCRLLESLSQDDTFLSHFRSLDGKVSPHTVSTSPPRVAGYEVLEEVGRGGMGVVYKARQLGANRLVALKLMLAGAHAGRDERQRFRSEAEAVARVRHPNVVQVYEVGEQDGLLFFSMELVEGGSLADEERTPLPPRAAAALLESLARGVAAAHEQGIVHRDLKPANILLSFELGVLSSELRENVASPDHSELRTQNSKLVPKVTDFGLAKWVGREAWLTRTGLVAGTPSYMAPEQARGDRDQVGPAADVWALGAVLYKALTGHAPFHGPTAMDTLAMVAAREPVAPRQLQPAVPRDLETICLKCLHKQPEQRYATALELADDLRRFQTGEPIGARRVGPVTRLWLWCRRNPVVAGLIFLVLVSVVAGSAGSAYFAVQEKWQADQARLHAIDAENRRVDSEQAAARADQEKGNALRELALRESTLMTTQLLRVASCWETDPGQGARLLLDEQRCPPRLRDFTWGLFYRLCQPGHFGLSGYTGPVRALACSTDGTFFATGCDDKAVRVWDVAATHRDSKKRFTLRGHQQVVSAVAISPDGQLLASGTGRGAEGISAQAVPGELKLWDLTTGKERAPLQGHTTPITAVAFSPDGQTLASAGGTRTEGEVRLWDVAAGQEKAKLTGEPRWGAFIDLAFSADGQNLAAYATGGAVRIWDPATGKVRQTLTSHLSQGEAILFWPHIPNRLVCSGLYGGLRSPAVSVLDITKPTSLPGAMYFMEEPVQAMTISPDGHTLVTGGKKGALVLWALPEGKKRKTIPAHPALITRVAFLGNSQRLVSTSTDGMAGVWNVNAQPSRLTSAQPNEEVTAVAFSPDSRWIAAASRDRMVRICDRATGEPTLRPILLPGPVLSLAFAPDGRTLAAGYEVGPRKAGPSRSWMSKQATRRRSARATIIRCPLWRSPMMVRRWRRPDRLFRAATRTT